MLETTVIDNAGQIAGVLGSAGAPYLNPGVTKFQGWLFEFLGSMVLMWVILGRTSCALMAQYLCLTDPSSTPSRHLHTRSVWPWVFCRWLAATSLEPPSILLATLAQLCLAIVTASPQAFLQTGLLEPN